MRFRSPKRATGRAPTPQIPGGNGGSSTASGPWFGWCWRSQMPSVELARHSRRLFRVAILCTWGLPLGVMLLVTWSVHTSDPDWVVLPIVVALGYLLILSILALDARSGAKMVKETADALRVR